MFCCVGGGPKRLFKIKLWKSPTVNIGLASATGKSGRMCKSHLDSFHNSAVIGGQRCHPSKWWVLSALKDIAQSRGDAANVETEQEQQRRRSVLPVIATATGNIIIFMHCVCSMCFFFALLIKVLMYSKVGYLGKNKLNNIEFHPNLLSQLPTNRLDMHHFPSQ